MAHEPHSSRLQCYSDVLYQTASTLQGFATACVPNFRTTALLCAHGRHTRNPAVFDDLCEYAGFASPGAAPQVARAGRAAAAPATGGRRHRLHGPAGARPYMPRLCCILAWTLTLERDMQMPFSDTSCSPCCAACARCGSGERSWTRVVPCAEQDPAVRSFDPLRERAGGGGPAGGAARGGRGRVPALRADRHAAVLRDGRAARHGGARSAFAWQHPRAQHCVRGEDGAAHRSANG